MSIPTVFDRRRLRQRRDRAACLESPLSFLHDEVADRLAERMADMRRRFGRVLEIGAREGAFAARLPPDAASELIACDLSERWLARTQAGLAIVADEELLPFAAGAFDAVISRMSLHWVNDLPGALAQIVSALKPDGLFLAAFPGGETLRELRHALLEAELELRGGVSPRLSPVVDLRDAAALLQRAGLALPVADVDRITVNYADPWRLVMELRAMGEAAALVRHGGPLRRDVLARALEIYRREFGDAAGRVPATFDIVFMTGWRPDDSQPKPRPHGSASTRLAEILRPPSRSG
jgi:NADH dehydrogenase [ubiquinone] 1 alpha subcomplex assembly factor 5